MDTVTFFQGHRVFSLDEAVRAVASSDGSDAVLERLKYAVGRGKVKTLVRDACGSIRGDASPAAFRLELFLSAVVLRRDLMLPDGGALGALGTP